MTGSCVTNTLTNINAQCHLLSPCISLRPVTSIFYIIFLFLYAFYMYVILENTKNIISTTYINFYFPRMRPKNTCLRRWKRHVLAKAMHINGFRFAKIPFFLIYNNKMRICIKRSLSKKFINGCRICFSYS